MNQLLSYLTNHAADQLVDSIKTHLHVQRYVTFIACQLFELHESINKLAHVDELHHDDSFVMCNIFDKFAQCNLIQLVVDHDHHDVL